MEGEKNECREYQWFMNREVSNSQVWMSQSTAPFPGNPRGAVLTGPAWKYHRDLVKYRTPYEQGAIQSLLAGSELIETPWKKSRKKTENFAVIFSELCRAGWSSIKNCNTPTRDTTPTDLLRRVVRSRRPYRVPTIRNVVSFRQHRDAATTTSNTLPPRTCQIIPDYFIITDDECAICWVIQNRDSALCSGKHVAKKTSSANPIARRWRKQCFSRRWYRCCRRFSEFSHCFCYR